MKRFDYQRFDQRFDYIKYDLQIQGLTARFGLNERTK